MKAYTVVSYTESPRRRTDRFDKYGKTPKDAARGIRGDLIYVYEGHHPRTRTLPGMGRPVWTNDPQIQRLSSYEENPSGVGIALGIAAVLGVGWLLLRPKKAAAAPAPSPTPSPAPNGDPKPEPAPGPQQKTKFVPDQPQQKSKSFHCTLTPEQYKAWGEIAQRFGPWLPPGTPPPKPSELKQQYPEFASQPNQRLMVATTNGTEIWLYGAWDVLPTKRDDVRKNICDWVKNPSTPILPT